MGIGGSGNRGRKAVRLHVGLQKAESSVITQIRTGDIALAAFPNKARVPGLQPPACACGHVNETASHVIGYCSRFEEECRRRVDARTGRENIW